MLFYLTSVSHLKCFLTFKRGKNCPDPKAQINFLSLLSKRGRKNWPNQVGQACFISIPSLFSVAVKNIGVFYLLFVILKQRGKKNFKKWTFDLLEGQKMLGWQQILMFSQRLKSNSLLKPTYSWWLFIKLVVLGTHLFCKLNRWVDIISKQHNGFELINRIYIVAINTILTPFKSKKTF